MRRDQIHVLEMNTISQTKAILDMFNRRWDIAGGRWVKRSCELKILSMKHRAKRILKDGHSIRKICSQLKKKKVTYVIWVPERNKRKQSRCSIWRCDI